MDKRRGRASWGPMPKGSRVVTSASYWYHPHKWNREAEASGIRRKVFCASLADVFEDWQGPMWLNTSGEFARSEMLLLPNGNWHIPGYVNQVPEGTRKLTMQDVRDRLFRLIEATPHLDWLLLTKRPENVMGMVPESWRISFPRNAWMGTSVENQEQAEIRIPYLVRIPAAVRFLSIEPLLGDVRLHRWKNITEWMGPTPTDTWAEFEWPEWVPQTLREHIESFWSASDRRSPKKWAASFVSRTESGHQGMPAFGSRVGLRDNWVVPAGDPFRETEGRIVPAWNNIAAVVFDDGSFRLGNGCHEGPGYFSKWRCADGQYLHRINWVIVGGESGPNARPMHPDWVRGLRDQCVAAGVPFFFKQWGAWAPPMVGEAYDTSRGRDGSPNAFLVGPDGLPHCFYPHDASQSECAQYKPMIRVGKNAAGRLLDGQEWSQWPEGAHG